MIGFNPRGRVGGASQVTVTASTYNAATRTLSGKTLKLTQVDIYVDTSKVGTTISDDKGAFSAQLPTDPDGASVSAKITLGSPPLVTPKKLPALPRPVGARLAAIGDSQVAYSSTFGGAIGGGASNYTGSLKAALSTGLGFLAWAKMLDSRFRFENWYDTSDPRGFNYVGGGQGVHGDHLDWPVSRPNAPFLGGILARLVAVLARKPDLLLLEGGVNTIATGDDNGIRSVDYIVSRLDRMLTLARFAGVPVVLMTIYPRLDWAANNAAGVQMIENTNAWIRAQAGRDGVAAIMDADPILRPNGVSDASMFRDQVHLTPKGALAVAERCFLPIVRNLVSAGTTYNRDQSVDNLLPVGILNLAGTTGVATNFGSNGQTFSGQVATGLSVNLGRNCSVVASKEVVSGALEQQKLVITPGGGAAQNYYELSVSGFVANEAFEAARWHQMYIEAELENAESLTFIGISGGHRNAASATLSQTLVLARESSSDYARGGFAGSRTLYLQTEPFRCDDPSQNRVAFSVWFTGNKLSPNVLTCRLRRPIIRRVPDPRPGWGYPV